MITISIMDKQACLIILGVPVHGEIPYHHGYHAAKVKQNSNINYSESNRLDATLNFGVRISPWNLKIASQYQIHRYTGCNTTCIPHVRLKTGPNPHPCVAHTQSRSWCLSKPHHPLRRNVSGTHMPCPCPPLPRSSSRPCRPQST